MRSNGLNYFGDSRACPEVYWNAEHSVKAIVSHFGNYTFIQRCQLYKKRNIKDYLFETARENVSHLINAAYKETDYKKALEKQTLEKSLNPAG